MKLRIISGIYGGRLIEAPSGHKTHPMSEKIRGAIFNMLGDVSEMSVLDAFAGSGALAIEAISRGSANVVAIDVDKNATQTIINNLKTLSVSNIKVSRANIRSWLGNNPKALFNLILCDPPFDDVKDDLLLHIANYLSTSGIIVYSLPSHHSFTLPKTFKLLSEKVYGDAKILIFTRNQTGSA